MNILMISPKFFPDVGGVEKHVFEVSSELIKKGYQVTVLTKKSNESFNDKQVINGINVIRFPNQGLLKTWKWLYKNRNLIKNSNIIHCHDYSVFILYYLPFRMLYFLKPVYITFHGFEGIVPIPKKIFYLRKLSEFLTRGNVCIGSYILKWYKTKTNHISYGGITPSRITNVSNNSFTFIGRLENDTGILLFIEALKIIKNKMGINLELDICGDGKLKDSIIKFGQENDLKIKVHGFTDPEEFLNKNRFVFSTGYLGILESLIKKRLVFSVYENQLKKDYLDSLNMSVICKSPEDLAEKIIYFIENPSEVSDIIDSRYEFAKSQTWKRVSETYTSLWGKN